MTVAPSTDAETSDDSLLAGRVLLRQPACGYRAAIDPVLLAAAVPALPGETVLDLGCGAGAATLCLAARLPGCRILGIELDPETAALAAGNAARNGFADRVEIRAADLAQRSALPGGIDRAMMNPPFLAAGTHTRAATAHKARSHGEGALDLAGWVEAARLSLRHRGTLTVVHRADRIDDLLAALHGRFGAIQVFPLWPRAGVAAKRVLVEATLGGRGAARILPGLVLHQEGGAYTEAAQAVLRDGHALPLTAPAG